MLAQSLKQPAALCFAAARAAVALVILSWTCAARGDGYVMQLQTVGSDFSPAAYIDGVPQTFLWNWSDGTTSTSYPLTSVDFGSSDSRTQYLTVELPSALTNFNIGYD